MKKIIPLLIAVLFLGSCDQFSNEPKVIPVNNQYTLTVPSYLSENGSLHEEASLQYANLFKEFYVIVIDEPKTEFSSALIDNLLTDSYNDDIDGYAKLILDNFTLSIEGFSASSIDKTIVNSMNARIATIEGSIDGIDVFYTFAAVEGKNKFYQILTWTLADKKDDFKDKMQGIVRSIQEIK